MVKKTRKSKADAHIRITYHEKVCAERMKTLFKRIDEMNKDVRELRMFMHRGKGAGAVAFVVLVVCSGSGRSSELGVGGGVVKAGGVSW